MANRKKYILIAALIFIQAFPARAVFALPSGAAAAERQAAQPAGQERADKAITRLVLANPADQSQTTVIATQNTAGLIPCLGRLQQGDAVVQDTANSSVFLNQANCFTVSLAAEPVVNRYAYVQTQLPSTVAQPYRIAITMPQNEIKNAELSVPAPVSGEASSVPMAVTAVAAYAIVERFGKNRDVRKIAGLTNFFSFNRLHMLRC